LLIQ
jgi:hypothetical protein